MAPPAHAAPVATALLPVGAKPAVLPPGNNRNAMSHASAPAHRLARDLLLVVVRERARHLAFVRRQMVQAVDPEDVLQLALLRAARHIADIREGDKLEAWFWSILRNTIHDENERQARQRALQQQLQRHNREPTPHEVATCACSLGVLQRLKPAYREVLRRADIDEQPLEHISVGLGITPNNAAVRLHRARKAMREALLSHCGTDSLRACQDCGCEDEPLPR